MTVPATPLVKTETPATLSTPEVQNEPTAPEKIVLAAYTEQLIARGFSKISGAARETQLFNRFDGSILSMTFIDDDFDAWLYKSGKKCTYRSTKYIARRLTHIVGTRFLPNKPIYYTSPESGCTWVNKYEKYKPKNESKDVPPLLLEFFERLWPIETERHICLQWLAHIFQHPEVRPSWHLMLPSIAGVGKGFLLEEIMHPLLRHTAVINSFSKLTGQFSTVCEDNLLVLLDDCKAKSEATTTAIKSLMSEERAFVERKNQQGAMVKIFVRFILASNEAKPLHLDEDERRWFVCTRLAHRDNAKETQQFIQRLYDWLQLPGSLDKVYNWFMAYDLNDPVKGIFNPKHVAQSATLKEIVGLSTNVHTQFIKDYIEDHKVFSNSDLMDAIAHEGLSRPADAHVKHILLELNYEAGQKRVGSEKAKKRLCYPVGMQLDEIRKLYEASLTKF